jgi:hypothetical protein
MRVRAPRRDTVAEVGGALGTIAGLKRRPSARPRSDHRRQFRLRFDDNLHAGGTSVERAWSRDGGLSMIDVRSKSYGC